MKTTTTHPTAPWRDGLGRFLDSRLGGWICLALILVLLAGMSVKHLHKVGRLRDGQFSKSALLRWLPQLRDMEKGVNIAEVYEYPNPPIMALILLPLVHLEPLTASLVWFWVKAGLTGIGVVFLFGWLTRFRAAPDLQDSQPAPPLPMRAVVLTLALSFLPILGDLDHGNVNLFILFLILSALTAYHRRLDLLAGVTMGLAIACKITPALFIPYWIWKRSWWAVGGCLFGLVLFLWPGFVPAAFLGWERNQNHVVSWYERMVKPYVLEGKVTTELANQSLPGVIFRLITHSPAETEWSKTENRYLPLWYINVLNLEPNQARWLVKGCMGLFVLLVVCCCRAPLDGSGGWRLSAELGIVLLGMLLFSERTWKHHCVTLVLPLAVICYVLTAYQPGRVLRWYLEGTLTIVILLIASTSSGFLPERWSDVSMAYGSYTVANLLLLMALAVLLCQRLPLHDFGQKELFVALPG